MVKHLLRLTSVTYDSNNVWQPKQFTGTHNTARRHCLLQSDNYQMRTLADIQLLDKMFARLSLMGLTSVKYYDNSVIANQTDGYLLVFIRLQALFLILAL